MNELSDLQQLLALPNLEIPAARNQRQLEKKQAEVETKLNHWLNLAASNLSNFAVQACVVRRTINENGQQNEVRRWSEEKLLPLTTGNAQGNYLVIAEDGRLFERQLDGQRVLRNEINDQITDDIFLFAPLESISNEHLKAVRSKVVNKLGSFGYAHWPELSEEERLTLVSLSGNKADVITALATCAGQERIQALQLFFSSAVPNSLRQELKEAGLEGELNPGAEALSWILSRHDWNTSPCWAKMARCAIAEDGDKAWELTKHPCPDLRARLADLIDDGESLLSWLTEETCPQVRRRILLSLGRSFTIRKLVQLLQTSGQKEMRETLGWCLVNWCTGIEQEEDWQALNRALSLTMGKFNRQALKEKLSVHEKLTSYFK